jgi:hypothetical protein
MSLAMFGLSGLSDDPPVSTADAMFNALDAAPPGAMVALYATENPTNEMYPVLRFPIVDVSVTDPTPSTAQFPVETPAPVVQSPVKTVANVSSAPPSSNSYDALIGLSKAAPKGIQTYYNIKTENALLAAANKSPVQPAPPMPSIEAHTNWTPLIIGVITLALIGGGVVILRSARS